ncbi:hypothetical protein EVAR_52584_1 [Eumeta japonica]|uniref:Uncharacterized protein n=1 Tax=Eumeta variegata TaxID=151549 RepID=A0A4C1SLY3_EUMVA|nr:hypothetical protein EVAR_52584_1 [Eumeta japonica]
MFDMTHICILADPPASLARGERATPTYAHRSQSDTAIHLAIARRQRAIDYRGEAPQALASRKSLVLEFATGARGIAGSGDIA